VAAKYGIVQHTKFSREVIGARWNETTSKWCLTIKHKDGKEEQEECNVVFSASGLFSTPNLPEIPGIKSYKGPIFHTSHYDHSVDLRGKRVALIGTGSSGTQIAPALARAAEHLTIYQRTANWIVPFAFFRSPITENMSWMLTNMPFYWNWYCYGSFLKSLNFFSLQKFDEDWKAKGGSISKRNDDVREALTEYINECLKDRPDLIKKMMPKHAPLVRRMAVDNGFYDTVKSAHVDLVTDGIERFTEKGVITENGEEREFDVVVLGAGFKVSQCLWPVEYIGTEGMTLQKLWKKDGARSYLGMTMPNYPNLFMFYGPNHQPRAGSVHSMGEIWARYTVSSLVKMIEKGAKSMEVRREVFDDYNTRLDLQNKDLIWEAEGRGYYVNEHGRQGVNMPWTNAEYHAMVQQPNFEDYYFK
jgi:4-hydroxyacetophenone monooxygenase